jgi:GNAT superfamily N-acetyltransferase
MQIDLTTASLNDTPMLAQMNRMMIDDEGSENPMSLDALEKRMRDWFENEIYQAVLIHRGGDVVGYVLYREETDEFNIDQINIYVRQFFIKRAYRRRGIGRIAFEQVARTCFAPGGLIVLEVLARSLQGRAFWERMGFQPFFTVYRRSVEVSTPQT